MTPVEALQLAFKDVPIPNDKAWQESVAKEAVEAARRHNPTAEELGQTSAFGSMRRTPVINAAVVFAHELVKHRDAFQLAGYSDGVERRAAVFLSLLKMRTANP